MYNNQLKKKPYFDPDIYKKVLEDAWLPPIAKEILKPWSVTHKHRFLFPGTKDRFKGFSIEEEKFINRVVEEESDYQFRIMMEYIETGEKEKQQWFEELRRDFNLPPDYKFE